MKNNKVKNEKKHHNKKIFLIMASITSMLWFWHYNFRFVEFIPLQGNIRDIPEYETWIERKDLWNNSSSIEKKCLKETIKSFNQDYKEKDNILYVRAFMFRDKNSIANYTRQLKKSCYDAEGNVISLEQRVGFFSKYLPRSMKKMATLLDDLFM